MITSTKCYVPLSHKDYLMASIATTYSVSMEDKASIDYSCDFQLIQVPHKNEHIEVVDLLLSLLLAKSEFTYHFKITLSLQDLNHKPNFEDLFKYLNSHLKVV